MKDSHKADELSKLLAATGMLNNYEGKFSDPQAWMACTQELKKIDWIFAYILGY